MSNTFYINDYMSDGLTASDAVEKCIAAALQSAENRTVVFDAKEYRLDRAITLPSNTQIILDGTILKQNDGVFDNIFRGANLTINPDDPYASPLEVKPQKNIKIIGKNGAQIIGPDVPKVGYHPVLKVEQNMTGDFWGWRTHMFSFSLGTNIEIAGLSLSQTMSWAISFDVCQNVYVHDLTINSDVKNGDGIDFRSGCHDCLIENIHGSTSDDTVACTALARGEKVSYPQKNYLYPSEPYCSLGVNDDRDVHHIVIRNIYTGGLCHGVICLAANGNQVHHVLIDNVIEPKNGGGREASVKIYTGYGSGYNVGDIHDIRVKNVVSETSDYAVLVKAETENVRLEDITQNNKNCEAIHGISQL